MRRVVVAVAALTLASGCGWFEDPEPTGVVTGVEFEAATTKTKCTGKGKKRRCRTVPDKPASWEIDVEQADGSVVEVHVSAVRGAGYEVGDQFP